MAANAIDINPLIKITRNSFKMGLLAKNRPNFAQLKFDWQTSSIGCWRGRSGAILLLW